MCASAQVNSRMRASRFDGSRCVYGFGARDGTWLCFVSCVGGVILLFARAK